MLLTADGIPYTTPIPGPSPEEETRLRAALQQLDPLLGVVWVPIVVWNTRDLRWEGRYALTCRWPGLDKRWSEVQAGKVPASEAHDILGWFCEDMQNASSAPTTLDGIQERTLALLGAIDNLRYPWKERMERSAQKNRDVHTRARAAASDLTHDVAEHFYRQAKGVPLSAGADFNEKGINV